MRFGRFSFRYILFFETLTGFSWLVLAYVQLRDCLTQGVDEWQGVVFCTFLAITAFFVAWSLYRGRLWAVIVSWLTGATLSVIGAIAVWDYVQRLMQQQDTTLQTLVYGWMILLPAAALLIALSMPQTGDYFVTTKKRKTVVSL